MRKGLCAVLLLSLVAWRAGAEPSCGVIVLVDGEPALTAQVKTSLEARGLQTREEDGCPALRVELQRRDGGLWLGLTDLSGRIGERMVTEPETAAALIEAWARADLSAPLLLIRQTPSTQPESGPATEPASRVPPTLPTTLNIAPVPSGAITGRVFSLEAELISAEQSIGAGLLASGGVQRPNVLLGGYLRGYTSIQQNICDATCAAESPGAEIDTRRSGWDVMALLGSSLYARRLALSLGVGVGFGWVRPSSAFSEARGEREFGPRMDARVELLRPLSEHSSFVLGAGFGSAPLADDLGQILEDGFQLAPSPRSYLRGSFGVRVVIP